MSEPVYNTIGVSYNTTRKADPWITERIFQLLHPLQDGSYLDIGCGTGNYLKALSARAGQWCGADPSETMLKQAREKNPHLGLFQASAEELPFKEGQFDGATAMLTFHHWQDQCAGLRELKRVLKPGARLVFLSFTLQQMRGYWLYRYFPEMIETSGRLVPTLDEMEQMLRSSGFEPEVTEKYFIREDLEDHFLYSNKFRPEAYLLPGIRQNASGFSQNCSPEELASGLAALETDIQTGTITEVMKQYQNDLGDYLFLSARKKH